MTVRINTGAQKVLRVFKALKGKTLDGVSNKELSAALGLSPSMITICIDTLIAEGLAQRLESGRFALGIAALQIAQAHANEMDRALSRIHEINSRVAAGAR